MNIQKPVVQSRDTQAGRNANYDLLRILATFAVVWLHTSADVVTADPSVTSVQWWIGNVADSMSRWAVPVFVLISGAMLLATDSDPLPFYRRRAARILPALVFWSIFYLIFQHFTDKPLTPAAMVQAVVHGQPYFHLWYLYMMLGLYAVTPVLRKIVANSSPLFLWSLVWTGFALSSLENQLSNLNEAGSTQTFLALFLYYVPYYLAGYAFTLSPPLEHRWRAVVAAILCVAGIAGLTAILFLDKDIGENAWEITYQPLNPFVIGLSLCLFRLMMSLDIRSERLRWAIARLAPLTLGIYLLHPFWLWVLAHYDIDPFIVNPAAGIPLVVTAAFILSALTTAILMPIPLVRRIVS